LKAALTFLALIVVIAASAYASFAMTMRTLSGQDVIFDTFEQVDSTWLYTDKIGVAAASDVERARVAIGGPLGLSAKEAVYFVAVQDGDGEPLRSQCRYRVTGQPIDTRWWSLTLYDSETQHYVPNEENRSSWNSVAVPRSAAGEWVVEIASTPQEGAWLPAQSEAEKAFELMLRVYNPSDATRQVLPNIALPTVERVSC